MFSLHIHECGCDYDIIFYAPFLVLTLKHCNSALVMHSGNYIYTFI